MQYEPAARGLPSTEARTIADIGPPIFLTTLGLILWLAVNATISGISVQTIGLILFIVGVLWLLISLFQASTARRSDRTVVREREVL